MSTTAIDNTEIKFDRITKDYAVLVDGVAVAYGRNYSEAEGKRTAYLAAQVPESACAGFGCVDGCGDCATDLGGPGGVDIYAAAFNADAPDLIVEAGILVNTLEEMTYDLIHDCAGMNPTPADLKTHTRLCRILAKAERRLQRREFAELGSDPPGDNPLGDDEGDSLPDSIWHRLAVNRVIVSFHKTLHIPCRLCQGDHLIQHCPSIRALLFAEPVVMVMDVEHTPVGWAA